MITEASDIYDKIALKYGVSKEQVRDAIIFFWRTGVKRSLEHMVSNEIYIPKLGSFIIKEWKLKYVIPSSLAISQREGIHERNAEYFTMLNERLVEVQNRINQKEEEYREFLRKNPQYIPKPSQDMGGSTE